MTFTHLPDRPDTLTAAWAQSTYDALVARVDAAEASTSAEAWLALYAGWNELKSYVSGEECRSYFALSKDTGDESKSEWERRIREEVQPVAKTGDAALTAALLKSRHVDAIADRYGAQLIRVLRVYEETLAPVNSDLRVLEGAIETRYDKLTSDGRVRIRGEEYNLTTARSLTDGDDAALRREAFAAYYGWFLQHREEFVGLLGELVAVRDEMGRNLGHEDYVALGYAKMGRTDYGREEAERFRDAVHEHLSPLYAESMRQQAVALETETVAAWD